MVWEEPGGESKFLFKITGVESELLVVEFSVNERISYPFECSVSFASEDEIKFDNAVGKEALLTILGPDTDRYVHGLISELRRAGVKGRFYLYYARVVPSLWMLSLEYDCRIFQDKSVQDIVTQVLQEGGITGDRAVFRLQGQPPTREYCVQYRETDLAFISRLLEEEGIFYFFEHSEDKHVLVFGDSKVAYKPIEGQAEVAFHTIDQMVPEEEFVYVFSSARNVLSGKYTQTDFDFEKPSLDLTTDKQGDSHQKLEVYDYPGKYFDQGRGTNLTQVRLQETRTFKEKAEGRSVCPRLTPAFTFKLKEHECQDFNAEYLLVEVIHKGSQRQVLQEYSYGAGGAGSSASPGSSGAATQPAGPEAGGFSYTNEFLGIPSSVVFRPFRKTPKAMVRGLQTALIVGPKGEEIYTDKYGRVKVQFHWDRDSKADEKSSCWIRVGQVWAGKEWGTMFIPRIGQEVLVEFLEGDPDRPLITGRVYNAECMPPYKLPDHSTKSTIKSLSSKGGEGFNEIRFEDKKGEEQFFIHAEKNQDIRVKNDCFEWIGKNRHLIVKQDQFEEVENNRNEKVAMDHMEEIGKDRHLKIKGKEAIDVTGSHSFSVTGDVIEVFKANHSEQTTQNYYLKAMGIVIEAMQGITIKCGGSSVVIDQTGVTIKGAMVTIDGGMTKINSGPGSPPQSGQAGSAVPPAAPTKPEEADKAEPGAMTEVRGKGRGSGSGSGSDSESKPFKPDEDKKSWIEIELVDEEDNPVPGERYRIETPDGKVAEGTLDQKGLARVDGIDPGTCKITFPRLDREAWERA
jgi:type VI secretion system secreted protein VgrG